MRVEFKRTGERRYGVFVKRENLPDLEMNPAIGFDSLIPHDLMHFLVEQEFNLQNAIFGQVAAGGTAGTFRQMSSSKSSGRIDSRLRKKTVEQGKKILKSGLDDCVKSEQATVICLYDWFSHSTDETLRARANEIKANYKSILLQMPEAERKFYTEKKLAQIRGRMDEISARWFALKVNDSIILEW